MMRLLLAITWSAALGLFAEQATAHGGLQSNSARNIPPATFQAKVVGVRDGDTVELLYQGRTVRVRLAHIDAPEAGQPFGKAAKQHLSTLCFGKQVRVQQTGRPDRYGRLIAVLYLNGVNLNKAMVSAGYAWHFTKYSRDGSYSAAQAQARTAKRGLWAQHNAVAPWEWRAMRRRK